MKMPFGKYKDKELTDIPRPYLRWLSSQDWVGAWLLYSIGETLGETVEDKPQEPWQPSEGEQWEGGNK